MPGTRRATRYRSAGDRILTGRNEYGSAVLAYLQLAQRTGAEVVVVPDDDSGQIDVAALADLVDERTRMIGLTWVPTAGGLVNPAAEVGRLARAADVLYLLDATQVVGQFPIDVSADRLRHAHRHRPQVPARPAGHGFPLCGTEGARSARPVRRRDPFRHLGGGRSFTWVDGARRFETWENSYVNVVGLGAAVRQALDVGLDRIGRRSAALGARLRTGLAEIDGVTVHDLGREQCAIVTARVAGVRQPETSRMRCRGGGSTSAPRLPSTTSSTARPRRPPHGAVVAALLQHRGGDRPGNRRDSGTCRQDSLVRCRPHPRR